MEEEDENEEEKDEEYNDKEEAEEEDDEGEEENNFLPKRYPTVLQSISCPSHHLSLLSSHLLEKNKK